MKNLILLSLIVSFSCHGMARLARPLAQLTKTKHIRLPATTPRATMKFLPRSHSSIATQQARARMPLHSPIKPKPFFQKPKFMWHRWAAAAAGLFSCTLFNQQQAQCEQEQPVDKKAWAPVREKYEKLFAQKEQELFDEFVEILGGIEKYKQLEPKIRNEIYDSFEDDFIDLKESEIVMPESLKQKVLEFLSKHDIQSDTVELFFIDRDVGSGMGCIGNNENFLFISEKDIKRPLDLFEALLSHEIQHIKDFRNNRNLIMANTPGIFINSKKQRQFRRFELLRRHYFEMKADIMAGLENPKYAKALMNDFAISAQFGLEHEERMEACGYTYFHHPLKKNRVAYLRNLHDEMQAAIKEYEKQQKSSS